MRGFVIQNLNVMFYGQIMAHCEIEPLQLEANESINMYFDF